MKAFAYTAQCESGAAIEGTLEAIDTDEAVKQLTLMRLANINLRDAPPEARRPISTEDFLFFNEQLASLADSGLCLDVGLRQLGKDIQSPRLRRMLEQTAAEIERGTPLDKALEKHAAAMPALYSRVVRAGIENGQLSGTLLNLSHHVRMIAETRRLVAEALAYPAIVLTLAAGMMCAILLLLVPQFEEMFVGFGAPLPGLTVWFIEIARILPQLLMGAGIVIISLIVTWLLLRLSPGGRLIREKVLLGIPVLGAVLGDSIRARFLRAMAFSVRSGIPLPEALRLSADAIASPIASRDQRLIADRVEQGESLYSSCQHARLIPSMFGYVVGVGGSRDTLENGLTQLSKVYELRAVHGQSRLRTWLAPAGVIFVGLMIGLCILALFLPTASLFNYVGGGW